MTKKKIDTNQMIADAKVLQEQLYNVISKLRDERYEVIDSKIAEGQKEIFENYKINTLPAGIRVVMGNHNLLVECDAMAMRIEYNVMPWLDNTVEFDPNKARVTFSTVGSSNTFVKADPNMPNEFKDMVRKAEEQKAIFDWASQTNMIDLLSDIVENTNRVKEEMKDFHKAEIDTLEAERDEYINDCVDFIFERIEEGDDVSNLVETKTVNSYRLNRPIHSTAIFLKHALRAGKAGFRVEHQFEDVDFKPKRQTFNPEDVKTTIRHRIIRNY